TAGAVGKDHLDLNGRIAAAVEDFSGVEVLDFHDAIRLVGGERERQPPSPNPKHEIRNPKQIPNPNTESDRNNLVLFGISDLVFVSDLVLRISSKAADALRSPRSIGARP